MKAKIPLPYVICDKGIIPQSGMEVYQLKRESKIVMVLLGDMNDIYHTNVRVKFHNGDWGVYGFPNRRMAELFIADIPRMQMLLEACPELDNGIDYEWRDIVGAIIAPTMICAN